MFNNARIWIFATVSTLVFRSVPAFSAILTNGRTPTGPRRGSRAGLASVAALTTLVVLVGMVPGVAQQDVLAHSIEASGGNAFSGVTAGADQVLSVLVRNAAGSPVEGYSVSWTVTAGGGSLSAPTSVTGGDGIASITLTTGTTAGTNTVEASGNKADGNPLVGSPVPFTINTVESDLVATSITAVTDTFLQTGQTATITARVLWAEDPPGSPTIGDPYPFAKVQLYKNGVAVPGSAGLKVANSQGFVNFPVTDGVVSVNEYEVRTVGFNPSPSRVVSESGALAGRTTEITFTKLEVVSLAALDDVLGKGKTVDLRLTFQWAHPGPESVSGLGLGAVLATLQGQGSGNDPLNLVPDTPTSGNVGGWADVGAGVYNLTYTHSLYESLRFGLAGGPVTDGGLGGATSNFDLPTGATEYVHWVGAYVSDLSFVNAADATDPTGNFVNLDNTINVIANVVYTPNHNPAGTNGLLGSGNNPAPVNGATVSVFEMSHLDAAFATAPTPPAANPDSKASGVTTAAGQATIPVNKATFSQLPLLRDGANTYGVQVFPTSVPGIPDQSIVQPDAATLSQTGTVTFTALDLAYVAASLLGSADPESGTAGGTEVRWWFGMDNSKGDANTDPLDTDSATLNLHVTWRHDGADAQSATVMVRDGAAFLNDGVADLVGSPSGATGVSTVTFDPDTYGLDALIKNLEFVAVSAPEPGVVGASITQSKDTFTQEFLWSRIALIAGIEPTSDDEVDLGKSVEIFVIPVYYHDEFSTGRPYYFTPDYNVADATLYDRITDMAYAVQLTDTVAPPSGLSTRIYADIPSTDIATFAVFGGCSDLMDATTCAATPAVAQAGFHTYVGTPSIAPHSLTVEPFQTDVLYTAAVIDAGTGRLTAPVGTDITMTARSYYAHTRLSDGSLLSDVGFGAGNRPYLNGVTADVKFDGVIVPGGAGVGFVSGALIHAFPSPVAAGHHNILVDGTGLADDGTTVPLTLVYDSATLERVWLSAAISIADPRTTYTDRSLQIRGRGVDVFFDVDFTDGNSIVEVTGANTGYAFTANENNPANRFDRTLSTVPSTAPATVKVVGPAGQEFSAAYAALPGCACWKATITGFNAVAADQLFDLSASVPLTEDAALTPDVGTTVTAAIPDAFEVDFTALQLAVVTAGNTFYQSDLAEFWYNLGTGATFEVTATWAHDDSAARGATIRVEDPAVPGSALAGATATDSNNDGTYDLSVPSPGTSIGRTYSLAVESIPSTALGEAALTDSTPFTIDPDSLTLALAQPHLVHTRALFEWTGAYDGKFVNRDQSSVLDFEVTWEHDGTGVDRAHGWRMGFGGAGPESEVLAGVTPQEVLPGAFLASGTFDVTRSTSGAITLTPTIFVIPGDLEAPRGIDAEAYTGGADAHQVTWTAILMDIDDALGSPATHPVGTPVTVKAKASLEHEPAVFKSGVVSKLIGTAQTTGSCLFGTDPGACVDLKVLSPGTITAFAEGISYDVGLGKVLGSGNGKDITASTDDSVDMTFA